MIYRIRCYVWGGITGSRQAWLKEDDKIYETPNKEEAEKKAQDLKDQMICSFSPASFNYRVVEMF